jgi:hypothetical protein
MLGDQHLDRSVYAVHVSPSASRRYDASAAHDSPGGTLECENYSLAGHEPHGHDRRPFGQEFDGPVAATRRLVFPNRLLSLISLRIAQTSHFCAMRRRRKFVEGRHVPSIR